MKFLVVYIVVVLTWIILSILGALGPEVNVVEEFRLKTCLVDRRADHISDDEHPMISMNSCGERGMLIDHIDTDKLKKYQSYDVIFFVAMPIKRSERKMSRLYQYIIADIHIGLRSDYAKQLKEHNHQLLQYHVSLGYRNHDDQHWTRLVTGNASRLLDCDVTQWGTHRCKHFPLFELWSCHYDHYLVNIRLPHLPFTSPDHSHQFKGISAIKEMAITEIHQNPVFTRMWLVVKCLFFVMSLLILLIYRNTLLGLTLYLLLSMTFVNAPFELLSLWLDVPWIVVLNDFRIGLLMGLLCLHWIWFISQTESSSWTFNEMLTQNWISVVLLCVSCVTFFVYEFCERGVQVIRPFYSLWGTEQGKYICYSMVALATTTASLFLISMFGKLVKTCLKLRKMHYQATSSVAKLKTWELSGFVMLTASVSVFSVLGYVVPVEMYLLHWAHTNRHLSLYGALLLSNYGLWNVYVFAVTVLYSNIKANVKLLDKTSH